MPERKEIYRVADTCPMFYVNSVQIGQTPIDMRIDMGVVEHADPEQLVTRVVARVYMALPHAKIFSDLLVGNLVDAEARGQPRIVTPHLAGPAGPPRGPHPRR